MTILEVLVTVGIIALLAALLIPAVQNSRQAALRVECRNQLRQLGIAVSNYESAYGVYPTVRFRHQLLPFIEVTEAASVVPLYTCPADRRHATGRLVFGQVSYSICAGLGSSKREFAGVASVNRRPVRSRDVSDGLSNTAMISERLSLPFYAPQVVAWDDVPQDWPRTFHYFAATELPASPDEFADTCSTRAVRPVGTWLFTDRYHHLMTPNGRSCVAVSDSGLPIAGGDFNIGAAASSVHPGGIHTLFSDGSVSFVSSGIALEVWRAQGTRSGGEVF